MESIKGTQTSFTPVQKSENRAPKFDVFMLRDSNCLDHLAPPELRAPQHISCPRGCIPEIRSSGARHTQ